MCLLFSLRAQTYGNWEAVVVHDGPLEGNDKLKQGAIKVLGERGSGKRIEFLTTPAHAGRFGHPWRDWGFQRTRGDYLCTTNDDNYLVPTYFEAMLHALTSQNASFAYCDCVHSHKQWAPMTTELKRGKIDLGCWMARRELVLAHPWTDHGFAGDWTYIDTLTKAVRKAAQKTVKVPMTLFVHN